MIQESLWGFRLILAIFTCYRLAYMLAKDDGPLFLFKRIRYWVFDKAYWEARNEGETLIEDGEEVIDDRYFGKWHSLSEGIECPYCLGVWFSLPLFALVLWPTYYGDLFLILMTISGVQAFMWGLVNK